MHCISCEEARSKGNIFILATISLTLDWETIGVKLKLQSKASNWYWFSCTSLINLEAQQPKVQSHCQYYSSQHKLVTVLLHIQFCTHKGEETHGKKQNIKEIETEKT